MKKILLSCFLSLGLGASAQTYCVPAFASGCADGDQINSFSIPSAGFSHLNTGCSNAAYGDFSATQTVTLQASLPYNFTVDHGYSGQYVNIWADFNNDGTFDPASELIGSGSSGSGLQTASTITVPAGTPVGTYRMRVADRWNTAPIPCNTDGYGEAHDYTLAVTSPPTCTIPTAASTTVISSSSLQVSFTAPLTAPALGYTVYYSTVN